MQPLHDAPCGVGIVGAVGVDANLELALGHQAAHAFDERELALGVVAAYLELDAVVSLRNLDAQPVKHLLHIAHPHQAVDEDALFAARKRSVEQREAAGLQVEQSRLEPEEDRREVAQLVVKQPPCRRRLVGQPLDGPAVSAAEVAAQVGQGGALAYAHASVGRVSHHEPYDSLMISAARRGGRIDEMKMPFDDLERSVWLYDH